MEISVLPRTMEPPSGWRLLTLLAAVGLAGMGIGALVPAPSAGGAAAACGGGFPFRAPPEAISEPAITREVNGRTSNAYGLTEYDRSPRALRRAWFITFDNGTNADDVEVLLAQARDTGAFDVVRAYNASGMTPLVARWAWRPTILLDALAHMGDGDVVLFAEASSRFTAADPSPFLQLAAAHGLVVFRYLGRLQKHHVKGYAAYRAGMHLGLWGKLPQVAAGALVAQKRDWVPTLMAEWARLTSGDNLFAVNDADTSGLVANDPAFIEHVHEHAMLSLLAYRHGVFQFPYQHARMAVGAHVLAAPAWNVRREELGVVNGSTPTPRSSPPPPLVMAAGTADSEDPELDARLFAANAAAAAAATAAEAELAATAAQTMEAMRAAHAAAAQAAAGAATHTASPTATGGGGGVEEEDEARATSTSTTAPNDGQAGDSEDATKDVGKAAGQGTAAPDDAPGDDRRLPSVRGARGLVLDGDAVLAAGLLPRRRQR